MNEAEARTQLAGLRARYATASDPAERVRLAEQIKSLVEHLPEGERTASGGGTAHPTAGSHLRRAPPAYFTRMMVPEIDS